jgi:predicted nucleic acid-binding protein
VTTVADASVVAAYLLGEASDAERDRILGDVHAPALVDVETSQTLRGLLRAAKIDLMTAEHAREALPLLRMRRHPDGRLLRRAWELRDVCTIYDALYVGLAEALNATLLTRDGRLARGVTGLIDVVES